MKNASEFEKVWAGQCLSEKEREIIGELVHRICENHKDDDWDKIYLGITNTVYFTLSRQLSDDSFIESLNKEENTGGNNDENIQ